MRLLAFLTAVATTAASDKWVYPNVPWPLPQHMTAGKQAVVLASVRHVVCDT
jgi:hypothetical protein